MAFLAWLGEASLVVILIIDIMFGGYAVGKIVDNKVQGDRATGIAVFILMCILGCLIGFIIRRY